MAVHKQNEVIQNRKNRERLLREETIISAAKKLFCAKGYMKTTMDEIAMEAEISKPTVYQYFKNKDDLYFSLTLPILQRLVSDMETMTKIIASGGYKTGAEIVNDHFETYIALYNDDPEAFGIFMLFQLTGTVFDVNEEVSRAIGSLARERYDGMRGVYATAIKRGLIKDVNVYYLVDMIWGSFLGILQSLGAKTSSAGTHKEFIPTLEFARGLISDAIALRGDEQ
ncbi:MAG TPA: TetR/AcrR family transcriptional regulator [Spirochaetota bacterium]|nr:TetR/AcrR family transcriptional regulator [Spirochaetota bacterium]HPI89122.1 TetR/AcrR family transcriptional regulator [Spirochaetota bacterium]HPR48876.1 TetR/AcrR family transcriptional regulator [Spirochaetota bacterium]